MWAFFTSSALVFCNLFVTHKTSHANNYKSEFK
jgi:hypothetical protein